MELTTEHFAELAGGFAGRIHLEPAMRRLYATDASVYQQMPAAVAIPMTDEDIRLLIHFARKHGTSLIPRTAGTSLAGQVVGGGIVVDVSRHFTRIIEINATERWARVQPGVIRDELNMALRPHGLLFGPETSTANRAMIGGMVGNNSCGSNSLVYGSTRDHLLEARGFLSDGSEVVFGPLSAEQFNAKCDGPTELLETRIYRQIRESLTDAMAREEIVREFPKSQIHRRNTGYAIDLLMDASPLNGSEKPFNFCKLLAGSEGTLLFITEVKLDLSPLPPPEAALLCAHFENIDQALRANLIALKYKPYASELIDRLILDCTKVNLEQSRNRDFVVGDPGAVLVVELRDQTRQQAQAAAAALEAELRQAGLGYHYPVLYGAEGNKVWSLRKAGLGLLSNIPGDERPVAVIEDTAVAPEDLPQYIQEFDRRLAALGQKRLVHYAHAGSGEIHIRPMVDLKTAEGNQLFRTIALTIAQLVKEYRGSLSGEHGDGRLRGEFLRLMVGQRNYDLIRKIKQTWDPLGIFNPGKIVDTPPMNTSLRYMPGQGKSQPLTVLNFDGTEGILRAAEMCNGSGDCRKTHLSGGTMCPSYMATRDERDTTRARANTLRSVLTQSSQPNPFDSDEIKQVMDLCLMCKGCKAECPSNVDMARLKAEFLQQYYDARGTAWRTRMIGHFARACRWASLAPWAWNFVVGNRFTSALVKRAMGFAPRRSMPRLHRTTLRRWFSARPAPLAPPKHGIVYLFCDEFTNYNDVPVGIKTVELLERLGYEVRIPDHVESGRAMISKGLLREARALAGENVRRLRTAIDAAHPLLGIEPSAILSFRDEYPDLVHGDLRDDAKKLAGNCLMVDEFLAREIDAGRVSPDSFTDRPGLVRLHGHCHQKAIVSVAPTVKCLKLVRNYQVQVIPSGCCGMAGSFGYEAEHYELSMKIGELVLFPAIRELPADAMIAAPGTSCRQQIKDGTGRIALHPLEILHGAMK